jgi:hypothetical protein
MWFVLTPGARPVRLQTGGVCSISFEEAQMILFWQILVVVAIGVIAATVAKNWDKIVVAWKGKTIAVVGARRVGKTTLIRFLTTGSLPAEYAQTVGTTRVASARRNLRDLELNLKETVDVPGAAEAYGEWKAAIERADVVLYLFRADKIWLEDRPTIRQVVSDMRQVGQWLDDVREGDRQKRDVAQGPVRRFTQMERGRSGPAFYLVGTHCDLHRDFAILTADKIGDYNDRFRELDVMKTLVLLAGGKSSVRVVLGSMSSEEYTESLAYSIFSQAL